MTLMEYVETWRERREIKVKDLAAFAEITPDYYNKLVKGVSQPSWPIVQRMVKALNLRIILTDNESFNEF